MMCRVVSCRVVSCRVVAHHMDYSVMKFLPYYNTGEGGFGQSTLSTLTTTLSLEQANIGGEGVRSSYEESS
jgi:hypothetical protein